ncbi:MAG: TRAP transporter small permease [Pusillimonas sp.]
MASNHTVFRAYSALVSGLAIASGAIFGLMAFFIGADVFMRNVTGAGLSWVIELMEYAMYVATVFAAPWVLREGGHVSVDILTSMLPVRWGRATGALAALFGSVICFIVFYYSALATLRAFERGSMVYKSFTVPEWLVSIFVPLGMFFMVIEFLLLFKTRLARTTSAVSR